LRQACFLPLERRAGQFAGWMFRTTTRKINAPEAEQSSPGQSYRTLSAADSCGWGIHRASGGGFSRFPLFAGGEGESQWQSSDSRPDSLSHSLIVH
jgi:hypothetical protein